ncbi:MAG TPA: uracil-DNA glycosylase [Candidatus Saccharimonadales bacterium]|nr:uracil-DNA glycosylase [Candidatus Saccharimonadales bacterium]
MASTKLTELDKIKQQIVVDNICPELATSAKQLVFGDGNANAELVFVGEAPGKNEDLQGLPFVGAAGKFLNEMLAMIDLSRDDVYITNVVKYRPPNNRDPYPDEKKAFLPYLQSQLEIIQPKVVVTLGRHSLNCFLPDLHISQVHGQPKRLKLSLKHQLGQSFQIVILPLFHPAAALYNNAMRQTLIDDFMLLPAIINKISTNYKPAKEVVNKE